MGPHEVSAKERGEGVLFQRIRRITGYLVGTLDRFNNAKRAEELERVKHGLGGWMPPPWAHSWGGLREQKRGSKRHLYTTFAVYRCLYLLDIKYFLYGLKIRRWQHLASSSLAPGTIKKIKGLRFVREPFFFVPKFQA